MKTKLIGVKAILAGLTAPVMILCGCSTVSVTTDHDPTVNFAKFRTYALEPPPKAPTLSPGADAALRTTLRENLAERGIIEVPPGSRPDLAVVPHVRTERRYNIQQFTSWGYGPGVWPYSGGFYGPWAGAPVTYNTISSYTEGTLILDFVDTSNQRLVFRGTGRGTVSNRRERNADKIQEAVEKIVARFPATGAGPVAGYESSTRAALSP
jgi:hypothetical protein